MVSLHTNCLQVCRSGPATRNRTWIDSLEGYCIIHYTMARLLLLVKQFFVEDLL